MPAGPSEAIISTVKQGEHEGTDMELAPTIIREARDRIETENRSEALPLAVEVLLSARTEDAVFVVDPSQRIVHWDPRAESLTGRLAEEVVGKPCNETLRGDCEGGGRLCARGCPVMRLAGAGHAVPTYDMRIETRMRGKRWVNVSILSVDTEEGPYLVHLMRDAQKTHDTLEMARDVIRRSSAERGVSAPDRTDVPELTPRQLEILRLLSAGKSAKEIGQDLYLAQATVRNHIRALLQALDAHSQLEALAQARKLGLLAG
jgi:PAS domain S-box-containing protein